MASPSMQVVSAGWDLLVIRDDLSKTDLVDVSVPKPGPGEALLKVDRVGVTTNNVTYAIAGGYLSYWNFFPAEEPFGRVPLWGFADVVASEADGAEIGTRVYGYLPMSSHLVVRPDGIRPEGFRDGAEHRAALDSAYNIYVATDKDASYAQDTEDLQILYRPLFITSFMLDDFLADNDFFGAQQIVVSSASSKTAYATAFCIARRAERPRLIALTSPGNLDFTRKLPYDDALTYDDLDDVSDRPTLYLDLAGNDKLRDRVHRHLGDRLVYDCLVGVTHQKRLEIGPASDLPGPEPVFFFAPSQISKRRKDWGPGEIDTRYGAAWNEFVPAVREWVDVKESQGPEGLRAAWLEVLSGRTDPKVGHVISL